MFPFFFLLSFLFLLLNLCDVCICISIKHSCVRQKKNRFQNIIVINSIRRRKITENVPIIDKYVRHSSDEIDEE